MEKFFATCPRGLEPLLAEDIAAAGVTDFKAIPGGVHFVADWPACYAINLHSRIATRVLWRVANGKYAREDDIYKLALDTPWAKWFGAKQTIRVDVVAVKSPLKSLEFITLRIKDAVCDRFRADQGVRPSVDTREPEVRIHGFLTADECTLYIDTSGAPLYQRGLRQKTVEAPLKENVAAGILRLSGWQPGTPLLDPMCGSGTFLVEAAQIALNIAPGAGGRSFGFQRLISGKTCSTPLRMPRSRRSRRRSTAATSRRWPCVRRWPTLIVPDCCPRSPWGPATFWKSTHPSPPAS